MKKYLLLDMGWILLLAFLLLTAVAAPARADRQITNATPAAPPITVAPGASIPATVYVTVSGKGSNAQWRSTGWRIATTVPGTVTCAATSTNYNSAGNYSDSFNMTAPATAGTYNVYYVAYSDTACKSGTPGTTNASNIYSGVIKVALPPPSVVSINRANANPANPGVLVAWTVTFSRSVKGVDANNFALAQGGGVSGASIVSVSGSGTIWTVTANTGSGFGTLGLNLIDNGTIVSDTDGSKLGGPGAGSGNFTGQVYDIQQTFCSPPANAPVGVSCVCDTFGRADLNPSTIFGGNWALSNSDGIGNPYINSATGKLRLTENTGNNAKAATAPGIFPAAGNYISVEFNHYAYNGNGADGIAVTLSDYVVPAVPGGYGGSLGYAQNTAASPSKPGFAGGWVGVALDEYGNYQNPTEGRVLGPGLRAGSVGVRGPGKDYNGYRWLGGTAANQTIAVSGATPGPSYMYQVIVDARNSASGSINISVNRDTTTKDGTNYVSMFGPFNAYNEAAYAVSQGWIAKLVPDYWKISFTGSTGGSNNIHEIGNLRICAQTIYPSTGGVASGFSAIDDAYPAAPGSTVPAYQNFQTGDIYMKLAGVPFNLWVAALTSTGISTAYAVGGNKYVSVKLVDNSDGVCGTDASRTCNSACVGKAAVESGGAQVMTFTSSNPGAKLSSLFTLNSAYRNLIAVMRECTTSACSAFTSTPPACSADSFSVRPTAVTAVTSSNATGASTFKAGSGNFALTATTANAVSGYASGYTGTLKINNAALQAVSPATAAGRVTPVQIGPATSAISSSTATGSAFTYSEVGAFRLLGYDPAVEGDSTKPRGVYDGVMSATECAGMTTAQCDILRAATWTGIDSVSTRDDCIPDSFSNNKVDGKYGCNFGLLKDKSGTFGRFIPNHFAISATSIVNRSAAACAPAASSFTYMGEPFRVGFTLMAMNASKEPTLNYASGVHANFTPASWHALGSNNSFGLWMTAADYALGGGTCDVFFSAATPSVTSFDCSGVANPAAVARAAGPRVAVTSALPTPTWVAGAASFTADVVLHRADQPDGAYANLKVGIAPRDGDGVGLLPDALDMDADNDGNDERATLGSTDVRYGRLLIPNIYGSSQLPLPVTVQAQYWNGPFGAYVFNGADSCTSLAAGNFSLTPGSGATIATSLSGGGTMRNGMGILNLSKPASTPTGNGSMILSTSTTAPAGLPLNSYLPGKGIETFGIYKSGPVIYFRERY